MIVGYQVYAPNVALDRAPRRRYLIRDIMCNRLNFTLFQLHIKKLNVLTQDNSRYKINKKKIHKI